MAVTSSHNALLKAAKTPEEVQSVAWSSVPYHTDEAYEPSQAKTKTKNPKPKTATKRPKQRTVVPESPIPPLTPSDKKAQRKLAIAIKYAEADAARAAADCSTAPKKDDHDEKLLQHPPMSEEERERDAKRRERALKAREERAAAAALEEAKAKAAAARASMATAASGMPQPTPSGPRKEAELVHASFVSEQERQARAAAGAQKQLEEAEAAAKKRAQKKAKAARQKQRAIEAAQAEREQELPAAPTLGAYIDLSALECDNESASSRPEETNAMSSLNPNAAVFVPQS